MRSGTAARTPRCSPHGTNNAIPAVCGGMPPHGPRGQKRGAPQTSGGHGASLGESRQGNGSEELLSRELIGFFLLVVALCQAQPYLSHLQQRGPSLRVLDRVRHLQTLLGVTPILL